MTKAKELSELASAATVTSGNVALSGGLDVDGVTDLDVVDIDGAVNISAATTIATNNKIQFRDAAIYLNSSADGQLDIVADTEIEMTTPLVEMSGALSVIGNRSGDYQTKLISTNTYGLRIQTTSTSDSHEQLGIYDGSNNLKFKVMGGGTVHATGINLGGSGAANRMDDYEEGTWTASVTGATTSRTNATGIYTKVGNLVTFSYYTLSSSISSASGYATITGLPFTAINHNSGDVPCSIANNSFFGGSTTEGQDAFVANNTTIIYFMNVGTAAQASMVNGSSKYLGISGSYISA